MLKYLLWMAAFAVAVAICSPARAQEGDSRFRYSLWSSEMGADIQVTSGNSFGTEFNLNDLAMDKKATIEVWEIEMWQGSLKMDISYWENKWEGYAQIIRDIVFEGISPPDGYNTGDVVKSSFKMRTTDVSFTTSLSSSSQANFGGIFGMKYIEYFIQLWDVTESVAAKEKVVAPIPYLGVSLELALGENTVFGSRFVMFNYAYRGTHVDVSNYYQVDAFLEFRAGTQVALRIGFHNMVIEYYNRTPGDRFKISQIIKGTYAAIYLSF